MLKRILLGLLFAAALSSVGCLFHRNNGCSDTSASRDSDCRK